MNSEEIWQRSTPRRFLADH